MLVAGADGCPKGWLVVFRSGGDPPRAQLFETFADVIAEGPDVIAVDIPIGLPTASARGGRKADREARKILGPKRQSSVFPSPSRSTIVATSFLEACEIELRNSIPPKKVSRQIYNIFDKIREVDSIARGRKNFIYECHPEVSFWAMNERAPMRLPKKASRNKDPSGLNETGLQERCKVLVRHGYDLKFLTTRIGKAVEHSRDDLIDACAAAWTAERIFKKDKRLTRLPSETDVDSMGLDMAIWA